MNTKNQKQAAATNARQRSLQPRMRQGRQSLLALLITLSMLIAPLAPVVPAIPASPPSVIETANPLTDFFARAQTLSGLPSLPRVGADLYNNLFAVQTAAAQTGICYVKATASGAGTGADWDNAYGGYSGLNTAITNCATVYVAEGTYTVTTNPGFNLTSTSANVIRGGFPAASTGTALSYNPIAYPTILNAGGARRIMVNAGKTTLTLQGLVMEGVAGFNTLGGAYFQNTAGVYNVQIIDMLVRNNALIAGAGGGAGFYVGNMQNGSTWTCSNSLFTGNQVGAPGDGAVNSSRGAGMEWANNAATSYGSYVFDACHFSNNHTAEYGALDIVQNAPYLTIQNTEFCGNTTAKWGAALFMFTMTTQPLRIINSTFTNNSSDQQGGAIGVFQSSNLDLQNSIFVGNSSLLWGGAIGDVSSGSVSSITNSYFYSNTASYGGAIADLEVGTFTGNTLVDNMATATSGTTGGGAIYGSTTTVTGNTFVNNSVPAGTFGGAYRGAATTFNTNQFYNNNIAGAFTSLGSDFHSGGGATVTDSALQLADASAYSGSGYTIGGNNTFGNAAIAVPTIVAGNCPVSLSSFTAAPGGVSANLQLWLKADAGVTGAVNVSQWDDQSGNNNHATQATASEQPLLMNNGLNFNPALSFDGAEPIGDHLIVTNNLGVPGTGNHTVFGIMQRDGIGNDDSYIGAGDSVTVPWAAGVRGSDLGRIVVDDLSYVGTSSITTEPILHNVIRNGANSFSLYLNGALEGAANQSVSGFDGTIDAYSNTMIGDAGTGGNEQLAGKIAEVVFYNRDLSAGEQQQVASYLALKYGITFNQTTAQDYLAADGTTQMWDATTNATYSNDIAGIGRDDGTALNQKQSKSVNTDGIVAIGLNDIAATNQANTATFAADKDFMLWGNNDGAATWTATGAPTNYELLARQWRVQETGTVGGVKLQFDVADADFDVPALIQGTAYHLIYDSNNNDDLSDETPIALTNSSGDLWETSTNIDFADGMEFTLATSLITIAPGGVSTNLLLWLKADAGITAEGDGDVTSWSDASGGGTVATQSTESDKPDYLTTTNLLNFNPAVHFIAGRDRLDISPTISPVDRVIYVVAAAEDNSSFRIAIDNGAHASLTRSSSGVLGSWAGGSQFSTATAEAGVPTLIRVDNDAGTTQVIGTNGQDTPSYASAVTDGADTIGNNSNSGINHPYGRISEVIFYDEASQSALHRQQIESYLALKYGIALDQTTTTDYLASDGTTTMWDATANAAYSNDITGIGRDDDSALNQKQSKSVNSDGIVTIGLNDIAATNQANTATFAADKTFMLWGNDDGTATWTVTGAPSGYERLSRQWRMQETGTVGAVKLQFDVADADFDVPALRGGTTYHLLYDSNNNDDLSDETPIALTNSSGDLWETSTNIDFADGMEFTLATLVAPTITQPVADPAAITIPENTTAITDVNSIDISDSEGSGLTYTLSGPDAISMTIDASGVLSFTTAPDFENPSSAASSNTYTVTVTVTDTGNLTDSVVIVVSVTNDPADDPATVNVCSIQTSRGNLTGGDGGYTLDGSYFTGKGRDKLLNPANFGASGTVSTAINIIDAFATSGSITAASLASNNCEIFFMGSFNNSLFTAAELDALYGWSRSGGVVIVTGQSPDSTATVERWGYTMTNQTQNPTTPTTAGSTHPTFDGPFGTISTVDQAGSAQAYLSSIACSTVLARNALGNPTITLDHATGDLVIADTDYFAIASSNGSGLNNNNDRLLANTFAYAIGLVGQPDLTICKSLTTEAGSLTADVGDAISFTLDIRNVGSSVATGVTVTDTLDAGFENPTVSTTGDIVINSTNGQYIWTLADLAAGAGGTIVINGTAGYSADPIVNTATCSANQDAEQLNNTSNEVAIFRPNLSCPTTLSTLTLCSIANSRQPGGDSGYTLDGSRMINHARPKLTDLANFGPSGTVPTTISIVDGFANPGDINAANLAQCDAFFVGAFTEGLASAITPAEMQALRDWSLAGGLAVLTCSPNSGNATCAAWGQNAQQESGTNPTVSLETGHPFFDGPFGTVTSLNQGGSVQGYFNTVSQATILAENSQDRPSILLDHATNDILVVDVDYFTNLGDMTTNATPTSGADILWANIFSNVVNNVCVSNANTAPTITQPASTPASISILENTTAITDVNTIDDTDGEITGTLTYGLSGPDAISMTIGITSGLLSFTTAPDFEAMGSAAGSNTYTVTVTVTDTGNLTDSVVIVINITDAVEATTITLPAKLFLQGAYDSGSGTMSDALRSLGDFPLTSPYGDGATTTSPVLAVSDANDAIVDWVLVELRDTGALSTTVVISGAALLQRDGDVVAVDGTSTFTMTGVVAGNYHVAIRHRNHLGVMTANPVAVSGSTALLNLTDGSTALWTDGTVHGVAVQTAGAVQLLWAGNANGDGSIIGAGGNNEITEIRGVVLGDPQNNSSGTPNANYIVSGYRDSDTNLDGVTIAAGPGSDVNWVLYNVLDHAGNSSRAANYMVNEQLP